MSDIDWRVDPTTRTEVEHLIQEHLWRLDHGAQDTLWELYADDIESSGPMGTTKGVDGVKRWGAERAKMSDLVGRHFVSGVRLAWVDGVLTAWTTYATYRSTSEDPLVPASVGDFIETFRRVDGHWVFQTRQIVPVFGGGNAAAHAARLAARRENA